MCGISGILSLNGKPISEIDTRIKKMTKTLYHRGPDQQGVHISKKKNFAMSQNRLSIVDPKKFFDLPLSKNGNEFLSFNGEIYNHVDLKKNLINKGIKFSTNCDQEVLYEFLKEFKSERLSELNGVWAFAFYNEQRNNLLLSRDLMGERHIFFSISKNEIIFSSEIKSILAGSVNNYEFDFESLLDSWKFYASSPGKTLLKNVFKLKPGHNLKVENGKVDIFQFQKINPRKWLDFFLRNPKPEKVEEEFQKIFEEEVQIRIPNEVKNFTCFSGGIDSTLYTHFLKKFEKNPNTLFQVSSNDQLLGIVQSADEKIVELEFAKNLSNKIGTNHSVDYMSIENSKIVVNELQSFSKECFEGAIDPGNINYSLLGKFVNKNGGKVLTMSEGPDELLGGYIADIEANKIDDIFGRFKSLNKLAKLDFIKSILNNFLKLEKNNEFEFSYKPFYSRVNHLVCPNKTLGKFFPENLFINKKFDFGVLDKDYEDLIDELDYSQLRALIYASKTLPDMYNFRADKAMMKNSVEVRLPYQAVTLVEFFIAMPRKYRFQGNWGKNFLRNYCKKYVDKNVSRRRKYGMGYDLFRQNTSKSFLTEVEEVIRNTNFFSNFPFKKNTINKILDHRTHPGNRWSAYCLINTYNSLSKINENNI